MSSIVGDVLRRTLAYGVAGWCLEVLYTGARSALRGDRAATATTYLWMPPVYAVGGIVLEGVRAALRGRGWSWWHRVPVHVVAIYAVEYAAGAAIRRAVGRCPWDYRRDGGYHVHGLVRLAHAPAWAACACAFELVTNRRGRAAR